MSEQKPPRDWLLARHADVTLRLDALRREALSAESISWATLLFEIFRPHRQAWRALALVWIGLLAVHVVASRARPPRPAHAPQPAVVAAWLNQLKSHDAFAQNDRRR